MVSLIGAVSDDIALNKRRSSGTGLFEGDWESEFGGKLRNFDDLFDEITPVPADTSAGNNILPRGPRVFRSLDPHENIPQELRGHRSPAALLESIDTRVLNHALRPRSTKPESFPPKLSPHLLYQTLQRHPLLLLLSYFLSNPSFQFRSKNPKKPLQLWETKELKKKKKREKLLWIASLPTRHGDGLS